MGLISSGDRSSEALTWLNAVDGADPLDAVQVAVAINLPPEEVLWERLQLRDDPGQEGRQQDHRDGTAEDQGG